MRLIHSLLPLASAVVAASAANAPDLEIQVPISPEVLWQIPELGFGTWNLDNATEAVSYALQSGYRHIDAAAIYRNEPAVGRGIADGLKKSGLARWDIWVTSKLWNDHHDPSRVEKAIDKTLEDLGLDYLDLYHMHWPVASDDGDNKISFLDTWEAMVKLVKKGKARHIGISNFSPAQLDELLSSSSFKPYAHQLETHPYLQQEDWLAYHKARGIRVTAYSPLGGTNPTYHRRAEDGPTPLLQNKKIAKIAAKHDATPAQVALAWGLSRGTSVIPKSAHAERIDENFASKRVKLDADDFAVIAKLGRKSTFRYNNPSKSWGLKLYDGLDDA